MPVDERNRRRGARTPARRRTHGRRRIDWAAVALVLGVLLVIVGAGAIAALAWGGAATP